MLRLSQSAHALNHTTATDLDFYVLDGLMPATETFEAYTIPEDEF